MMPSSCSITGMAGSVPGPLSHCRSWWQIHAPSRGTSMVLRGTASTILVNPACDYSMSAIMYACLGVGRGGGWRRSRTSHIVTVTWLDFYSGATLLLRTFESYRMTQHSRNRVTWLSRYERLCFITFAIVDENCVSVFRMKVICATFKTIMKWNNISHI